MLRLVFEVADIEPPLGLAGRYGDPVFQHSLRHCVGLVGVLVKAGSVVFVTDGVEARLSFFVAKKAGAQRFIIDARASNQHFLRPPSRPVLTGEGLCHVQFQGPEDAQNWIVDSADTEMRMRFIRCAFFDGCKRCLHFPLFSAFRSWLFAQKKNDQPETI